MVQQWNWLAFLFTLTSDVMLLRSLPVANFRYWINVCTMSAVAFNSFSRSEAFHLYSFLFFFFPPFFVAFFFNPPFIYLFIRIAVGFRPQFFQSPRFGSSVKIWMNNYCWIQVTNGILQEDSYCRRHHRRRRRATAKAACHRCVTPCHPNWSQKRWSSSMSTGA